jgi:hypothetical protein
VTTLPREGIIARAEFDWERLVHASHRFYLPVLTGLCLFSGGVLLARDPGDTSELAAVALFGLGAGALVSSLAYLQWRSSVRSGSGNLLAAPAVAPTREDYLPIPDTSSTPEWEDRFVRRFEPRGQTAQTSGPLYAVFTPTPEGDRLWVCWLPNEVGELPIELIGPIASSDAAVIERDEWTPAVGADSSGPEEPSPGGTAEVPLETSAQVISPASVDLPADAYESVTDPPVLDSISLPTRSPTTVGDRTAAQRVQPSSEAPHWMRSVLAEALNPVPPHLRGNQRYATAHYAISAADPGASDASPMGGLSGPSAPAGLARL